MLAVLDGTDKENFRYTECSIEQHYSRKFKMSLGRFIFKSEEACLFDEFCILTQIKL